MKPLIFLIFIVNIIHCKIKVTDFCTKLEINGKKQECHGEYNLSCIGILCTKDIYTCWGIKYLRGLKYLQNSEENYYFCQSWYETFMNQIKICPKPPEYTWNPNDVCLNTKDCLQTTFWRIWSTLLKPAECKCKGKYNYKCNSDYCASDKRACNYLKETKKFQIKKC